jgi:hypothetical protein
VEFSYLPGGDLVTWAIASPAHFIPELPGWRERSLLIEREGLVSFYHYDPCSQALAKIQRGHAQHSPTSTSSWPGTWWIDTASAGCSTPPQLYRHPAIDPASFRKRVEEALRPKPPGS